jgi:predicted transcriptional regulator
MRVVGDLSNYLEREVRVGPLPSGVVLIGKIIRADIEALVEITSIVSVPRTTVKNIMTPNPVVAKVDDQVETYIKYFAEKRFRGIPVVDDNRRPIGLLMASKVMELLSRCELKARVGDVMMHDPPTIQEDEDVHEAIRLMVSSGIGRLLVVDSEDRLVGIITRTDILTRITTIEQLV